MYNKYSNVNSLVALKGQKPRRNYAPDVSSLTEFNSSDVDLKMLANFGLEMMKFLPDLEQWMYENGTYVSEEGSTLTAGGEDYTLNDEWLELFNQYSISVTDIDAGIYEDIYDFNTDNGYTGDDWDLDGDGYVTNEETIAFVEEAEIVDNGFEDWRTYSYWVAGQHHRSDSFGISETYTDSIGGSGIGTSFSNVSFMDAASDWNHISDNETAFSYDDDAMFADDFVTNWSNVTDLLEDDYAGESFYEIVMNNSYSGCSNEDAFNLVAGMLESRERSWYVMSEMFGDVTNTRDDAAVKEAIYDFLHSHNPNVDFHEMSLLVSFFYMQHSFTNAVYKFYEKSSGQGFSVSALDDVRFWDFAEGMGSDAYKYAHDEYGNGVAKYSSTSNDNYYRLKASEDYGTGDDDGDISAIGQLFEYRDGLWNDYIEYNADDGVYELDAGEKAELDAVDDLIDEWFGAAYAENERPLYEYALESEERYNPITNSYLGSWVTLSHPITIQDANSTSDYYEASRVFIPDVSPSYGYDRKDVRYKWITTADDTSTAISVYSRCEGWLEISADLYSQGVTNNYINPLIDDTAHPNYNVVQHDGLSFNEQLSGSDFNNNWAVYAAGMFYKYGTGKSMIKVMQKISLNRIYAARYKQEQKDYTEKKYELEDEEKELAKALQKKAAKLKKMQNEILKKEQKKAESKSKGKASTSAQSGNGSHESYKSAIQAYLLRMQKKWNAKRKEMLNKARNANK